MLIYLVPKCDEGVLIGLCMGSPNQTVSNNNSSGRTANHFTAENVTEFYLKNTEILCITDVKCIIHEFNLPVYLPSPQFAIYLDASRSSKIASF